MIANNLPIRAPLNGSANMLLRGCAFGALALCLASPAVAQDAQQDTGESASDSGDDVIVVTGLRGSLQRNLDEKRNAPGVVDVISAEDIGKFPDSNVAASLQRLPGVSIQRSGARGEATGITVRGFGGDFNTTLYDGRRISTATGGRQIDFSTVGVDFIGQLSVLKTPDVSLSSDSIGATVNIEFPNPFDSPGFRAAVTASGSIQDRSGDIVPTAGILVSNTWNDTFGVLGSVVYTRRDTDSNRVYVSGWPGGNFAPCQLAGSSAESCAPTGATVDPDVPAANQRTIPGWFPQQYGAEQQRVNDERVDARLALQWQPAYGTMITLDNNYSRQKVTSENYAFGVWFNQTDLRNVELDENGTAVNFTQAGSPTDFTSALNKQILETNQTGLNIEFEATDNLTFELDGAYAKSKLNPGDVIGSLNADVGYGGALGTNLQFIVDGDSSGAFPSLANFGPAGVGADWANTDLIGSHVTVNQTQRNEDELWQLRAQGQWEQDDLKLQFGGQYYEDRFNFANYSTFVNNFWQAYAGYGAPSGRDTGIAPLPASLYEGSISLDNFIPGFDGSLPPSVFLISPVAYQEYLTSLGNPQTQNIPGYNYGCCGTNFTGTFDQALDGGSVRDITEKTWALYLRASFNTEISGMPFFLSAGMRNEHSNISANGNGTVPLQILTSTADPTLLTVVLSDPQELTAKTSYNYLLPSLDARLEITPEFQARFSASRTITRPTLNLLYPQLNVGTGQRIGALSAAGGNPELKPYLADNFDLAFEWYYQPNSYLSVNGFLKNVSNFIIGGVTNQTINDVIDPTTGQPAVFAVTQQVNGPDATVKGIELALQHVFGDSGFGFQANATFVETNRPYDENDISQTGFAVTGLANSANFVGFYDKDGFQIRAAANWRDEYLLQFGQNQNTGSFGAEPTFVDESFQIDLTSSYDINDNFSVFGEILNVNNNKQSTHGRFSNQLLDVFDYGRRYTAGVRFRY